MSKKTTEGKLKEIAREVAQKAEPVIDSARKAAEPLVRDVKVAARPYRRY